MFSVLEEDDPRATNDSGHRDEMYEGDPQSPVHPFVISKQFSKIKQKYVCKYLHLDLHTWNK